MYNIEVEFPFSCVHLRELEDSEFPFQLVDGPLDEDSRMEPFQLFSGLNYCLFAKIEKGRVFSFQFKFEFSIIYIYIYRIKFNYADISFVKKFDLEN